MSSFFRSLARDAHRVSKVSGDIDAARRSPSAYAKRVARRRVTRAIFRALGNGGRR